MLLTLFRDETLRKKLSEKAKAHARHYYSLGACVREVGDTYRKLAGVGGVHAGTATKPAYEYSPRGYLQAAGPQDPSGVANEASTPADLQQFEVELARQLLPRMKIAVDIGAGSGLFCLVAAKEIGPGGIVIAYKTRPECLATVREAVYLNNWEERLLIRPFALDAVASRVRVQALASGPASDGHLGDDGSTESEMNAADTLDNQFAEMHVDRLDLLRISGQSSDLTSVLRGAQGAIARYSPVLLIGITDARLETNQPRRGDRRPVIWLQDQGYAVYECTKDLRLGKVGPNVPLLSAGSYVCFRIGLHRRLEKQIRTWALKRRIRGFFWHRHTDQTIKSPRKPGRLGKAIRNPVSALTSVVGTLVSIYQNRGRRGRRSDSEKGGLSPK